MAVSVAVAGEMGASTSAALPFDRGAQTEGEKKVGNGKASISAAGHQCGIPESEGSGYQNTRDICTINVIHPHGVHQAERIPDVLTTWTPRYTVRKRLSGACLDRNLTPEA